ncbi:MAG: hypothetical protein SV377_01665 [Halobacteria archaeon]|nr:hypothetical protein [Halobacteria archaeon]
MPFGYSDIASVWLAGVLVGYALSIRVAPVLDFIYPWMSWIVAIGGAILIYGVGKYREEGSS